MGNITSIFVLAKMAGQNFFDSLLIALTTIDTVFIIFTIVDYSLARGESRTFSVYVFWPVLYAIRSKQEKTIFKATNIFIGV